jgi:LPXTG-motif cell wall-anchored protein
MDDDDTDDSSDDSDDSLQNGEGDTGDFLDSTGADYEANQDAFSAADNGIVSSSGGSTTQTLPNWFNSLASTASGLAQTAKTIGSAINPATGQPMPSTPYTGVAAQNPTAASTPSKTNWLLWGGLGLLGLLAFIFFRKT